MKTVNQPLASAVALALGIGSTSLAHAAVLDLTFTDNATPGANPLSGTVGAFAPGTEFRFVTTAGSKVNDGQKDVMFGGESWTFSGASLVGAVLTGVSGTDTNSGIGTAAPITSGVSGFPVCQVAGTCATILQNTDFLGFQKSFIAPIAGSPVGNAFGEAQVQKFNPGDIGNDIEIFFPVINLQWAQGNYVYGTSPDRTFPGSPTGSFTKGAGPGVLFFGETNGSGGFTLWSEIDGVRQEGSIQSVATQTLQWELTGSYSASAVPLPASVWLFGSGLAGLVGLGRRRRKPA